MVSTNGPNIINRYFSTYLTLHLEEKITVTSFLVHCTSSAYDADIIQTSLMGMLLLHKEDLYSVRIVRSLLPDGVELTLHGSRSHWYIDEHKDNVLVDELLIKNIHFRYWTNRLP